MRSKSVIFFFQRRQTAISDMKLARMLQSGFLLFFCFFFVSSNLIPGLLAIPRCRLGNQDLHVNRTRISAFWVSRGSRCEDRCQAPRILTSVWDARNCGLKQNPKQTSQLVSGTSQSALTKRRGRHTLSSVILGTERKV